MQSRWCRCRASMRFLERQKSALQSTNDRAVVQGWRSNAAKLSWYLTPVHNLRLVEHLRHHRPVYHMPYYVHPSNFASLDVNLHNVIKPDQSRVPKLTTPHHCHLSPRP